MLGLATFAGGRDALVASATAAADRVQQQPAIAPLDGVDDRYGVERRAWLDHVLKGPDLDAYFAARLNTEV